MEKVTIELTVNEVNAIRQMLHFAVQARGLEVAEAAVILNRKLGEAIDGEAVTEPQTTPPLPASATALNRSRNG